jgi:hypothetical protein
MVTLELSTDMGSAMDDKKSDDQYSEQEAQRRTEAALRAAFTAPHKPQSEMKLGKSKAKPKKSRNAAGDPIKG